MNIDALKRQLIEDYETNERAKEVEMKISEAIAGEGGILGEIIGDTAGKAARTIVEPLTQKEPDF